jgi:hypothetical protein
VPLSRTPRSASPASFRLGPASFTFNHPPKLPPSFARRPPLLSPLLALTASVGALALSPQAYPPAVANRVDSTTARRNLVLGVMPAMLMRVRPTRIRYLHGADHYFTGRVRAEAKVRHQKIHDQAHESGRARCASPLAIPSSSRATCGELSTTLRVMSHRFTTFVVLASLAACRRDVPSTVQEAAPKAAESPHVEAAPFDTLVSCKQELGSPAAAALVQQCISVSPATHPPCNAANSCALVRAEVARSCRFLGLGKDASNTPACAGLDNEPGQAQSALERYYSAINAHDFGTAFRLWGREGEASGKTLDVFRAGFAQTARSELSVTKPAQIEGAAGSMYATLGVEVRATLRNGVQQHFVGDYVLRRVNDVDGADPDSLQWHIDSASLRVAP